MKNFEIDQYDFISLDTSAFAHFVWRLGNFIRRHRKLYLFIESIRSLKRYGIKKTARRMTVGIRRKSSSLKANVFLSKIDRSRQERKVFSKPVKISIIAVVNNTKEQFLREMMESVMAQTYGNWELCLAIGSGSKYANVKHYVEKDSRIKYRKFDSNLSMPEKLNRAVEMSCGEYIGFLEQGDILHPSALFEVMKAICDKGADFIFSDEANFFGNYTTLRHHKPDYAFDTLCSHNYIGHFTVFDRTLIDKAGVFRKEFNGSHDYDLILRYTSNASKVHHIPKLLYFQRDDYASAISDIGKKIEAISVAENVIKEHLKKQGLSARVESKAGLPGFYRVRYDLTEQPLVSIIIPNKDNAPLLRNCISCILEKTTYKNYEIIIVENNSSEDAIFVFYDELKSCENIRVVNWVEKGFNFSKICNFGAQYASGQHLVFFNNDVLIITPRWIEEMLMYSQRSDVGAVGAKLYFLNGSIQHAGVVLGLRGEAGHIYLGAPYNATGFMGKLQITQNMSAVTGACMMVKKAVFEEVGQFDPEFLVAYNDIDLCIKMRMAGYLVVWTPYAEAYHLESKSRGYNTTFKKQSVVDSETSLFKARWGKELASGDKYNRNFLIEETDYSRRQ